MTSVFFLCFFAFFCTVILNVFSEISPKFRFLMLCGAGLLFTSLFLKEIAPYFSYLKTMVADSQFGSYFSLLIKATGISLLITLSADLCRDLGEENTAGKLELCGKAAILSLSLPLLTKILEFIGELTN